MPTLRSRTSVQVPVLRDIQARIEYASDSIILSEFQATRKYFKDNPDAIIDFWLGEANRFDASHEPHQVLLGHLFAFVGLSHPSVVAFLHTVQSKQDLDALNITRAHRGETVYYRIRVGEVA
jgi:hypothetical protein